MTSFWYVFVSDLGISATADSNMPSVVASYLVVAAKGETNAEQRKRAASPQICGAQDTGGICCPCKWDGGCIYGWWPISTMGYINTIIIGECILVIHHIVGLVYVSYYWLG